MKYIIFKNNKIVMPVIFHEHINHSDLNLGQEWIPVSAGFVHLKDGRLEVDYDSCSLSLKLKPNRTDGAVIFALINNFSVSLFIDDENTFYPNPTKLI